MNKYQHGKIYKITNTINDEFYVGSTKDPLKVRFQRHMNAGKQPRYTELKMYRAMEELGKEHFQIEIIEEYPCTSRKELLLREEFYINELRPPYNTYTKLVETRTSEQLNKYRYQQRKEYTLAYCKEYYQANAEKIKARVKAYAEENKEKVLEAKKKYRETHREELKAKKGKVVECPCGGKTTASHLGRHMTSKAHIAWVAQQTEA